MRKKNGTVCVTTRLHYDVGKFEERLGNAPAQTGPVQNKGPTPFEAEPFTLDSAWSHYGGSAQYFRDSF